MNVGELKKELENAPDDMLVFDWQTDYGYQEAEGHVYKLPAYAAKENKLPEGTEVFLIQ